jgi:hypothetical protein
MTLSGNLGVPHQKKTVCGQIPLGWRLAPAHGAALMRPTLAPAMALAFAYSLFMLNAGNLH